MKLTLKETPLHLLKDKPIMIDANIFMVGIEERPTDSRYSFESIKKLFLESIFEFFSDIYIHKAVYDELDGDARDFLAHYIGKNVQLVEEGELYGTDPQYTTIFNNIAGHELINYDRNSSKNRGEVFSMAYASFYSVNYFCSKDAMPDIVSNELEELENIEIITFDVILLVAYEYHQNKKDASHNKELKAVYKKYCADVIKRRGLPKTLGEYLEVNSEFL